jgi:nucleotide-binding universal stress UspA family protein
VDLAAPLPAASLDEEGEMKSILLYLADDARKQVRLELALKLATQHEATITGVAVIPTLMFTSYAMVQVSGDIIEQLRQEAQKQADDLIAWCNAACAKQGVIAHCRAEEGDPVRVLAAASRTADVVIIPQPDPSAAGNIDDERLAAELPLTAACPAIVVPYAGKFGIVGRRVLVAWNDTRESARAVHDALPLLKRAEAVTVLSVNAPKDQQIPGGEIAAYLAHHGVKAEASRTVAADIDIANALVSSITDYAADLLVMGAWGHSRLREFALGGATRGVLKQMTVPVFMSH